MNLGGRKTMEKKHILMFFNDFMKTKEPLEKYWVMDGTNIGPYFHPHIPIAHPRRQQKSPARGLKN